MSPALWMHLPMAESLLACTAQLPEPSSGGAANSNMTTFHNNTDERRDAANIRPGSISLPTPTPLAETVRKKRQ